jgi:hypothetical protein
MGEWHCWIADNACPHIDINSVRCMTDIDAPICVQVHPFGGANISAEARDLFAPDVPGYPANSPDFNPCELIISYIKRTAQRLYAQSETHDVRTFIHCVAVATDQVSVGMIHRIYRHIWRCMKDSIIAKGGYGKCVQQKSKRHDNIFHM